MESRQVDVAIIGTGTAGMSAYRAARAHTDRLVLIEDDAYGTTCARVGCMPSKLLVAAAEAAHAVRAAPGFGVHAAAARVDGAAVMQRVRAERDRFVGHVLETVQDWPDMHRLRGRARFVAPGILQVDESMRIEAARVVIATGSHPHVPAGWREALGTRLQVSADVFAWKELPRSVGVVGAGAIGLELGQALHRLGVRVRVFDRGGRLGPLGDPEVAAAARRVLAGEFALERGATVHRVQLQGEEVCVEFVREGITGRDRFECLLVATGRRANLEGLDLGAAGVPLDERGVPPSDPATCRIADTTVFIAGDAAARRMLLHDAADEGRIAGDNAGRWPDVRAVARSVPLAIAFTDPQLAVVGPGHAQLSRSGVAFATGAVDFADQGRSRVLRRNQGLLHVYGEHGSGRLLGAEMVAPGGEHLAHLLAWALQAGWTVQQALEAPYYHPVVEEGVRTALRSLARALQMGPAPVPRCIDCGPGA